MSFAAPVLVTDSTVQASGAGRPPAVHVGRPWHALGWVVVVALALLPALWASDAPLGGDAAELLAKAYQANEQGRWADRGLVGTVGLHYGPLPTWMYQVGLRVSPDILWLVRGHAVLIAAATLGSVAWIAWLLRWPVGWVLLIGASPYLFLYSRVIWDNTLCIPLAALMVALALHTFVRRVLWPLPVMLATAAALIMVHFMSLPLLAAVGLLLPVIAYPAVRRASMTARFGIVLAIGVAALALWGICGTYLDYLAAVQRFPTSVSSRSNGWWFACFSPRLISGVGLDYFFPPGYLGAGTASRLFRAAQWVSAGVYALAALGAVATLAGLVVRRNAVTLAGALALLMLAAQACVNGITHTYGHPHYYNATWIAAALLVGVALEQLRRWQPRLPNAVAVAVMAASAVCTAFVLLRVHATAGTATNAGSAFVGYYGPTIASQMKIVDHLDRHGVESLRRVDVIDLSHALVMLYLIQGHDVSARAGRAPAWVEVRYAVPGDLYQGRLDATVVPRDTPTTAP